MNIQPAKIERYLSKGSVSIDELKASTFLQNVEFAVVRLSDGRRALVSGGRDGIAFPAGMVQRIVLHTHPYSVGSAGPSAGDVAALRALGQRYSFILEKGQIIRFYAR